MGSIKRSFLPVLLFCFPLLFLAGQSPGSGSLSGEIQRIEKLLEDSRISGRERREALIGLARLWALSGSRERAAEAWIEAAFAEPGYRDDASLLEGTRCLIALGEFEKAGANVTAILQTGRDMAAQNRARYLGAWIEAFRTGNTGTLASFPDDPEYSSEGSALLYTLWKISGGESWKIRLEIDYPESPEARIARGGGPVGGKPTAMWLLMAGRDQIGVAEPVRVSPPAAPAAPQTAAKDGPVT
ncbi:MAG: hypothetical protein LBQ38_03860, partial [Spirochaetaceae bacterium]|nr:hypothetical protein [Spirochaetaceae bacterium]